MRVPCKVKFLNPEFFYLISFLCVNFWVNAFLVLKHLCFRVPTANVRLLEISQVERSIRCVEFIYYGGRQLRQTTRGRSLFVPGGRKKRGLTFLIGEEGRDQRKFLKFGRSIQLRYRSHYYFLFSERGGGSSCFLKTARDS